VRFLLDLVLELFNTVVSPPDASTNRQIVTAVIGLLVLIGLVAVLTWWRNRTFTPAP
jgi:hypothetical protein